MTSLQVLPSVKAGYKFEILLVLYENPEHRTRTGGYCERSNRNNPCDNAFRICVRTRGAPGDACDIRGLETTKIGENDDHLPFSEGQTVGGVRNPITITGDKWPVSKGVLPAFCYFFTQKIFVVECVFCKYCISISVVPWKLPCM